MKTHTGSCHCGAICYEVDAVMDSAMECNCSHCGRKGFLLKFVPASLFRLTKGSDEDTTEYRFNKKIISHRFCKTCGVQTHGRGKGPDGSEMVAVNIRTLDDGVPAEVKVEKYDGKKA